MTTGADGVEAALRSGNIAEAIAAADAVLADSESPDRERVAATLGAAYAARGHWSSAGELYGALPEPEHAFWASIASLVIGDLAGAEEASARGDDRLAASPAPFSRAVQLLAHGLLASIGRATAPAIETLIEAAELASARPDALLPDSPHAVGAVVTCEAHEFDGAALLIARAIAADVSGPLLGKRHQLLDAWIAMRAGRWADAQQALESLTDAPPAARDGVAAAALEAALAIRLGDLDRLLAARARILDAVNLHPVDLLSLPFFSELLGAAVRLTALGDLSRQSASAVSLLEGLGHPPLWRMAFTWVRFRAAAMAGALDEARSAAAVLADIEVPLPRLQPLKDAAAVWSAVLSGTVDRVPVEAAAHGLEGIGLRWEAGQLLGAAAVRTGNATDARALLARARDLRSGLPSPGGEGGGNLTEREREIGSCVLAGMSYKAIGEHLYISAKTVEHHVARIKTKLGAETRAEMLTHLRQILEPR